MTARAWRLAVDIGGTFTDAVLLDAATGEVVVEKALTTPAAPLDGVRSAVTSLLAKAGVRPVEITAPIVHATTLVTNALIEGKTARAAVVTTLGFGDTLEIRNEHRYDMYDLQLEFPPPPVPRSLVFELDERVTATGAVLTVPSAAALDALAAELRAADVEAVGVCLLNSYANPANERVVAAHLTAVLGVPVCVSSDVSPQIREYPRMVTTACNATTMPVLGPYLAELQAWLTAEGFGGSVLMMLSNGGVVSADDAARFPIRLVESGPAAGALAGAWYARRLGEDRLLCFDMGGTTAKSCLIEHADPELSNDFEVARVYRFKKGSGFPVSVPSVDLVEIGAGGGSLARVDDLGLLKVGPQSAGAEPGPACYGRGGVEPAVTDADLLLGNLDAGYFLGGEMPLATAAATDAMAKVAATLGVDVADCAAGVHELVNASMAAAARMHAVERGVDVRGVPLIAFGGAGPVHACGVAELLEAPRVIFPVNASVLSAFGTLVSPVRIDLPARRSPSSGPSIRPSAMPCSTSCATAAGPSWWPPGWTPPPCGSATGSMPATSGRATSSRCGWERATRSPSTPTRSCAASTPSTAGSTASPSPVSPWKASPTGCRPWRRPPTCRSARSPPRRASRSSTATAACASNAGGHPSTPRSTAAPCWRPATASPARPSWRSARPPR